MLLVVLLLPTSVFALEKNDSILASKRLMLKMEYNFSYALENLIDAVDVDSSSKQKFMCILKTPRSSKMVRHHIKLLYSEKKLRECGFLPNEIEQVKCIIDSINREFDGWVKIGIIDSRTLKKEYSEFIKTRPFVCVM